MAVGKLQSLGILGSQGIWSHKQAQSLEVAMRTFVGIEVRQSML